MQCSFLNKSPTITLCENECMGNVHEIHMVVSTVGSQQEGLGFDSRASGQVPRLPHSQKSEAKWEISIGRENEWLFVFVCPSMWLVYLS